MRRLDIFHSLFMEAVHLREQSIGHGVTPLLHEPRRVPAPRLHLLPLAISALETEKVSYLDNLVTKNVYRVNLKDLGPASQEPLVVVHHVLDVLPVQPGLLLVQAPDFLVTLSRGYHRFVKTLEYSNVY